MTLGSTVVAPVLNCETFYAQRRGLWKDLQSGMKMEVSQHRWSVGVSSDDLVQTAS